MSEDENSLVAIPKADYSSDRTIPEALIAAF